MISPINSKVWYGKIATQDLFADILRSKLELYTIRIKYKYTNIPLVQLFPILFMLLKGLDGLLALTSSCFALSENSWS